MTKEEKKEDNNNTGLIIGIIVGIIAFVILLYLFFRYYTYGSHFYKSDKNYMNNGETGPNWKEIPILPIGGEDLYP